ncbi:MAG TPA: type II secretion system protein [Planctomycetota bacterium]|jgi:prepilin-type N-terminal cleavage/methylation domain-containing protein|nr:type II secretion system protein [Planctomycetota bacterium]
MKPQAGFTLIELTVALAILVVASGLVIVRITGWSSRQSLHSSARTLGNTIRTWRERARTEETTYTLTIDENKYGIAAGRETLRLGRLGTGETFESGPKSITLTPRGLLPEQRIILRNGLGERVTLLIRALVNEVDYEETR